MGAAGRLWRWCLRNRTVASLIALAVGLLCAGTVVSTYFALRERALARDVREEKRLGDRRWYGLQASLAHRAWLDGRTTCAQQATGELVPGKTIPEDLRGFEAHYLDRLFHLDLQTLKGHESSVWEVAFHPSGRWVASAGHDRSIRIWDLTGEQPPRILRGHAEAVLCLAIAPDGERLVPSGADNTLRLWQFSTGTELARSEEKGARIVSVAFRPDGQRIVVGHNDGEVSVHDACALRRLATLSDPASPESRRARTGRITFCVAYSPDGRSVACAGTDNTIILRDGSSGAIVRVFSGHRASVHRVIFTPKGDELVSAADDGTVRVWDRATGRDVQVLGGQRSEVYALAASADGRRIAVADGGSLINVWDRHTGASVLTLRGHKGPVFSVAFGRGERCLASSGTDGTVKIWDASTTREFYTVRGLVAEGPVRQVAFSPDGRRLAFSSALGAVYVWNPALTAPTLLYTRHKGVVSSLAFSPDGRWLATAGADHVIRVWDPATGRDERVISQSSPGEIGALAFSPDGSTLAAGGGDGAVWLWERATGRLRGQLHRHVQGVCSVAFSPDGATLASLDETSRRPQGTDATLKLWDVAARREVGSLPAGPVYGAKVVFSPDGRTLAVPMARGAVELLDARTLRSKRTLHGHANDVTTLAYSRDGSRLVSAGVDGSIKLWDPLTAYEMLSLDADEITRDVALSGDGRVLASAHGGGIVKLWGTVGSASGGAAESEAQSLVRFLFERPMLRSHVIERLRADGTISEAARRRALEIAGDYPEDVRRLHEVSWAAVCNRRVESGAARAAVEQAQAACRIGPDRYQLALGLALARYRTGDYAGAIATLAEAEPLARAQTFWPDASGLSIRSMAQWRVGDHTGAKKTLEQAATAFKANHHALPGSAASDQDVRNLVDEARSIVTSE